MERTSLWRACLTGAVWLLAGCAVNLDWPTPALGPCDRNNGGCGVNAICSVAPDAGSATCVCEPGFAGDGKTCTAVPDGSSTDTGDDDAGPPDSGSPDQNTHDANMDGG